MKKAVEHRILNLKSKAFHEVDHLSILQDIYDDFQTGNKKYYLLSRFFINGYDDLPNLDQKHLWNSTAFENSRELFYKNHDTLIELIDAYYNLEEDEELIQEFHPNENLKSIYIEKSGLKNGTFKRFYDDTQLAYTSEFKNGQNNGGVKEWYPNGQLSESGKYIKGEYIVEQFWDKNGVQLLKDGTGKTIRKLGTNDYDVYEQYFENFDFKGEKKIQGVQFGKFEQNENNDKKQ